MRKMNFKILLWIVGSVLGISGCSNFLEVDPVGKTTISVFFSDMDGMRSAVPGAYSAIYSYYDGEFYQYGDVASDIVNLNLMGSDVDMIGQYNFTSSPDDESKAVGHIWKNIYEALANVNNILKYQPILFNKSREHSEELLKIKGEALFLRALCHFDLCRVYAQPYNYSTDASHLGIPVLLETPGPNDKVKRNTVKQVYNQIIEDLLNSEKCFGNMPMVDAYHASTKSVHALLSRVYLYMEDWKNVIKYSTYVIDESSLCYGKEYLNMYNGSNSATEAIFRLNGQEKRSTLSKFYSSETAIAFPSKKLMDLFNNPNDIRLGLFKKEEGANAISLKHALNELVQEGEQENDPFVLRTSEMYLNRAEAHLNRDELELAVADVKVIMARAVGQNVADFSLPELDKEALRSVIENERTREFCFEGQRFFDITRQKSDLVRDDESSSSVKHITYPSDLFILPIPQAELNANLDMEPNGE